jgi:hypothetical protein
MQELSKIGDLKTQVDESQCLKLKREKTGGRLPNGQSPNKVTRELREEIKTIVLAEISKYHQTNGNTKHINNLKKLLPFVLPKPVEVLGGVEPPIICIAHNI